MYNKLFTKILDSSIWLAPDPHRLVWITLIAAMDEDGNAMFACADNLAARARVELQDAESAIKAFESPDPKSGDPDNEGRRIERFPGGWKVLNAHKYRALVTKAVAREQTRLRVERYRQKKAGNVDVTAANASVTPSEADTEATSEAKRREKTARKTRLPPDWWPSGFHKDQGPTDELLKFRDHWASTGETRVDWEAAWRNWLRRSVDFAKKGPANAPLDESDKRRAQIFDLANLFGFVKGDNEPWQNFEKRVIDRNAKRLESLIHP